MWLRRALYRALWGAAFVLPLWVFLGRVFFGAPLGYAFITQIVLVPILFVLQVAATLVVFLRPSVRRTRSVAPLEAAALGVLWIGQLAIGFFLVDSSAASGSDAAGSAASAFTALVGPSAVSLSTALAGAGVVATLAGLAAVVIAAVRQAAQDARASLDRVMERSGMAGGQPGWASAPLAGHAAPRSGFAHDPENTIRITPRA